MCMCGMSLTRRQWLTMTLMASAGTLLPGRRARAAEISPAAKAVLEKTITVDTHSHARGLVFGPQMNDSLATGMRAGNLSSICLAHVADGPVIGRTASGVLGLVRTPAPGDLYKAHLGRLDWMDRFSTGYGMRRVSTLAELKEAKAKGEPALIQDIEGCDFLEGKLERLEEAHRRGVRVIQLVHYIPNDIGDFQTGPVTHNGMTEFGARVIKELNRLGALVDVAHATEPLVRQAAKVAAKPLLLSHTALENSKAQGETRLAGRQISADHARMIAGTGGVVGLWHFFPSIERLVDGIKEMVDVIGVDHVGVGTDQQLTPGALQDYASYGGLADEMLKKGFNAEETAKVLGGNFVRIFGQATGAT
jgi:membrane dipeptidase